MNVSNCTEIEPAHLNNWTNDRNMKQKKKKIKTYQESLNQFFIVSKADLAFNAEEKR